MATNFVIETRQNMCPVERNSLNKSDSAFLKEKWHYFCLTTGPKPHLFMLKEAVEY